MYSTSTGPARILLDVAVRTAERREARGELQWQSHQWQKEKKPPYIKTRAGPRTRITIAAIGLRVIEALQDAV